MTQDELLKKFVQFTSCDDKDDFALSTSLRASIYWKVKRANKMQVVPNLGNGYRSGLLYAFVDGIQRIDSDSDLQTFDAKLKALADELFLHLKAELS